MKRVYLASPISKGDLRHNITQSIDAFIRLTKAGLSPFNPVLSVYCTEPEMEWDYNQDRERYEETGRVICEATAMGNDQMTHEEWLRVDLDWVRVADVVLRLPGDSVGADAEVAEAQLYRIPVFTDIDVLINHYKELQP